MTQRPEDPGELKRQFLKESADRLRDMETGLLNIEQGLDVMEQVRLIFRGFHGLKGIAGYVNTREIIDLSNAGESMLMQVRDEGVPFRSEWVDLLLACHDHLKQLFDSYRAGEPPSDDWRESLDKINRIVEENAKGERSGAEEAHEERLFNETARPHISGMEVYFRKWKPGPADKRLVAAIRRKLALFAGAAEDAGRSDLAELAKERMDRLERFAAVDWSAEGIEEFTGIADELRSRLDNSSQAGSPTLRTPTIEPIRIPGTESVAQVMEIKADYVEALEGLVSDFTMYTEVISRNLKKMKPLVKPRAVPWLDGMESDMRKFARALTLSCRKLHLTPLITLFDRFPRLIRDLAKRKDKKVTLVIAGGETEVEKRQIEKLAEPMTHLIRNAVDHGLEPPAERTAAGKDIKGRLEIKASSSKRSVVLEVRDDGRGIDFGTIRAKAVALGVYTQEQADALPQHELMNLVFLTGLSTRSVADTISGRGVGMDIVREAVSELRGAVKVESAPGQGTVFTLTIPLELE